ncbi:TonB-dependent receptor plug domain-containing protein [Sphingosinithalassobacter sp. CS137]|uniref:TonB-dependent receptor plug domain-containing protein n=1 Tax=Sphingosinithalassobacter sp. CS137 TaxID=2762748 RepID=UPI00165D74EB|nr:TonB-dependent receptor [Sphingosinithalassobacter sp. CS137]
MLNYRILLCASAALLPAAPAAAQVASEDEAIVVTASGVAQSADETGRSITVLERKEIERRQSVVLSDLLSTTPGVATSRNGAIGGFTGVRIRGAEAEQTLVLIDGVRVNDPSSPGGSFDFGNLLTGSIERVEVLRGPNSVVWGSQAIGGVVNIATTAPVDGLAARADAEYGAADQIAANASIAAGNDRIQGAIGGGWFETDGISNAASGTEPDGYRQYRATGRLRAEVAPGLGAELRGYYADSRFDLDGFESAPPYGFVDTAEYAEAQQIFGYAGIFAELGPVTNRLGFSLADINRDSYDPAVGTDPIYLYRGRTERYEYQGDARLTDGVLRFVFGAEHENLRFYDGSDTFRADLTSLYGQAIVTPIEPLTLTAGVRNDSHSDFGDHTSFGANAALQLATGTLVRASYGEGFKAPTLYQLFAPFYGTATLEPETAESWEAGVEQSLLDERIRIGATYFHRDTRNQIDFDPATYTYANLARTRAEGVEFELSVRPVEALRLTANYTYTDTENRSEGFVGNDLARRPDDAASVLVDWRAPFGLALGATFTIVGDSFNDQGNYTRLDGYELVSVRAEMPVTERIAVYGRVENLFDEQYETVAGYGTYGRAAYAGVRLRLD